VKVQLALLVKLLLLLLPLPQLPALYENLPLLVLRALAPGAAARGVAAVSLA
jgi:hypothetical protein